MKLTSQQYAQALYDAISQTDSKDHDKVLDNFVKILAQNGDLGKHQAIEQAYKLLEMEEKGIHQAQLTVAREMEINSGIVNELNKIAKHKLDISKKVDAGIVGGLIMRVDDTLLDASVKMQLNKLNQLLKE
jgi:F-type H+-transporting ATPase subunit delta